MHISITQPQWVNLRQVVDLPEFFSSSITGVINMGLGTTVNLNFIFTMEIHTAKMAFLGKTQPYDLYFLE